MALQDPYAPPSAFGYWDDDLERQFQEAMNGPQQVTATEYPIGQIPQPFPDPTPPPPPPPPPPPHKLTQPGAPTQEEVPLGALPPPPPPGPPDIPYGVVDEEGKFSPAKPGDYITRLEPAEESAFQSWVKKENIPFDPSEAADYDMRGFWKALKSGDPRATTAINQSDGQLHFPDTWKTPNHATFSNESQYATGYAPEWQDDRLVDHAGNVVADESVPPDVEMPDEFVGNPDDLQGLDLTRELLKLSQTDPLKYAEYQQRHDQARLDREIAGHERIALEDRRRAEDASKVHDQAIQKAQQAQQQIETDAAELAKQKVDPERWWTSRSTGQKIAGFLSAVVGGFAMNKTGRNIGVEMMNQAIDEDIDAQKQNIASGRADLTRRQGVVAELYQRTGDLDRAAETARRVAKEQGLQSLEIEMMKYDTQGTAYRDLAKQVIAGRQQQAKDNEKYTQQVFENELKAGEYGLKVRDQQLKEKQYRDKAAGGVKPTKPDDVVMPAGFFESEYGKRPPRDMSQNQYEQWAKTGKVVEDYSKAARENSPEERNRQLSVGEIVDDQGDPVQFRDAAFAGKIADTKASIDTVSQYADEMIDLYNQHGFESDFLKSPAWRQAQGAFAAALLEAKNGDQLGALSGSDLELEAKKITGGVDVTGLRDPTAALQSFKRRMVAKVNSTIRSQAVLPKGRSVKPWTPVNTAASTMPKAKEDFIDELGKRLTTSLLKVPEATDNPVADFNQKVGGLATAPINKKTEEDLQALMSHAESGKYATRAKSLLRRLAKDTVYPDVRDRIKTYLEQVDAPVRER